MLVLPKPKTTGPTQDEINDAVRSATDADGVVRYPLARNVLVQESHYDPMAKSPAGAIGLMQLKPSTAKALGVDPYDWKQNIKGGFAYLRQLIDKYNGEEVLAAAAYNAGHHHIDNFLDGKYTLRKETLDYIPKVAPDYYSPPPVADKPPRPWVLGGRQTPRPATPNYVLPPAKGLGRESDALEYPGFSGAPSVDWRKDWRGIGSVLPGSRR